MHLNESRLSNKIIQEYSLEIAFLYSKLPNTCSMYNPSVEDFLFKSYYNPFVSKMKMDSGNKVYEFFDIQKIKELCLGLFNCEDIINMLTEMEYSLILFYDNDINSRYISLGYIAEHRYPEKKIPASAAKNKELYLVKDVSLNKLKIGISKNANDRLKQLQTASSNKLELISVIKNKSVNDEKDIQDRFKHLKTIGEWFHFSDEIINLFNKKTTNNEVRNMD